MVTTEKLIPREVLALARSDAVIVRIKTDAGWIRAAVMPMFDPQDDTL